MVTPWHWQQYQRPSHTIKVPKSPTALPPEAVPAWVHPRGRAYLKERGLTKDESERYDLHFCDGGVWSQRLIIPMYVNDILVAFQGRDVTGTDPGRYRTEGPRPIYCPVQPDTHAPGPLVIVEGPFDAFAVLRTYTAVATLGIYPSSAQIETLIQLVSAYHIPVTYVWFDNTATGEACALQLQLTPHIPTFVIVDEQQKDPGEYLCHTPANALGDVISRQGFHQPPQPNHHIRPTR